MLHRLVNTFLNLLQLLIISLYFGILSLDKNKKQGGSMNKAPFIRYLEGSRLYYDVLCSKGTFYYTVEMLGNVAISCECRAGEFKKPCNHKRTAEAAERDFQNSVKIENAHWVKEKRESLRLNGDRAFSLLR